MGSMSVTAYVEVTGPLFDRTADGVVDEITREISRRGAEFARQQMLDVRLDKSGRAKGGFQENLRVVERNSGFAVPGPMLWGVTWAPWLEGVSKRNRSARFRGYHLFRDATQTLEDYKAQEIADKVRDEYLPRLGGG
jgi:hypothetical protein